MKRLHLWWVDAAVVAIYSCLTIVMTWPFVLRLGTHFAGRSSDVWLNPWVTWWTEKVITEGRSLYYTDLMFYPRGVSLAFQSYSHVNTVLSLLLRPWLGSVGAHNATVLLAYALSGYAMFCLGRYVTRCSVGAFLAGLVFAFFPYRMAESPHPVIVSTQWMPWYFLFVMRLVREGHRRHVWPAVLFFFLTALTSWHLMVFLVLLTVAYLCYLVGFDRRLLTRATVLNLALLSLVACLVVAPFLYPLVKEHFTASVSYVGVDFESGKGNDLVAFLLPARRHPVWGRFVGPTYSRVGIRRPAYLGFTVLGLAVTAGLKVWRRARFWVLLAILCLLFSVGPRIRINGHATGVSVPWSVPVVWLLRHPWRFNILLGFALAMTSGLGLTALLARLGAGVLGWRWLCVGVSMALLLFEYLYVPFPTIAATVPDFYSRLSGSARPGAILELPMGRMPSKRYVYYQIVHGRPLVEGVVSRTPADAYDFIEMTPFLRSFLACGDEALPPVVSPSLGALKEEGIEYVILHKDFVKRASLQMWQDTEKTNADYEDERLAVYNTQAAPSGIAGMPQLLEACVAVRPLLTGTISAVQGETLDIPVEWIVGSSPEDDYVFELTLVSETGEIEQRHRYAVSPKVSLAEWHMASRHRETYPFQAPPFFPPGAYHLQAALVPVEDGEAILSAQLADVQLLARHRNFALPTMQRTVDAVFGHNLRLLGYDLQVESDAVQITLHWQALQRMESDYKFFVHLRRMEDGALVAQVDAMPHNWTYPTTWWEAEEMVSDEITIPLEGVQAGQYRLAIGVYSPETGQRLPTTDGARQPQPSDQTLLEVVSVP